MQNSCKLAFRGLSLPPTTQKQQIKTYKDTVVHSIKKIITHNYIKLNVITIKGWFGCRKISTDHNRYHQKKCKLEVKICSEVQNLRSGGTMEG